MLVGTSYDLRALLQSPNKSAKLLQYSFLSRLNVGTLIPTPVWVVASGQ